MKYKVAFTMLQQGMVEIDACSPEQAIKELHRMPVTELSKHLRRDAAIEPYSVRIENLPEPEELGEDG